MGRYHQGQPIQTCPMAQSPQTAKSPAIPKGDDRAAMTGWQLSRRVLLHPTRPQRPA
ncbi:hypothetical protein [Gluconacetobacter entanii]|uniref:hypothetical protein n=1 Tax=Gluconacetobacter entanii TaxID=108528 RepID=UPI00142D3594|nr:hypothetical protein [Gluconacetobacter entanii]MBE7620192.1 hypothetical protein [Komagataeibacter sp. FXV2]MCE2579792.1 hypothetical protein [Komagataeibacter sp. FNDCR1]MCW4595027.1 hypothetical protein [Gluconacetobacter entanii]